MEKRNTITEMIIEKQQVILSFAQKKEFTFRKADIVFDGWCSEHYESLQEFYKLITLQKEINAKKIAHAVVSAFYHLISTEDKIFLRDNLVVDDITLDEYGNEVRLSLVDKLMMACSHEDIKNITSCVVMSVMKSVPIEDEKKKTKGLVRKK